MKNIIFLLLICLPAWLMAQETEQVDVAIDVDQATEDQVTPGGAPQGETQRERLEETMVVLQRYLDDLSQERNKTKREGLRNNIQGLFAQINDMASKSVDNNTKASDLLEHLFPNKTLESLDSTDVVWVQGANGKYAVLNGLGELKKRPGENNPYTWEEPGRFNGTTAIARKGGLNYFVDINGEPSEQGYDFIHKTDRPQLFALQRTSKDQYVESAINAKTGDRLNNIKLLREGFYATSTEVFPFEKNGNWGLVNTRGAILTANQTYDFIGNVRGGYAKARKVVSYDLPGGDIVSDTTWGFLNQEGQLVPGDWGGIKYKAIGEFADKIAWVQNKAGIFYLIFVDNTFGGIGIQGPGQSLEELYQIFISDQIDNEGLITKSGNVKNAQPAKLPIERLAHGINLSKKEGKSRLIEKFKLNDQQGFTNKAGIPVIPPEYDKIVLGQEIRSKKNKDAEYPDYVVLHTYKNAFKGAVILKRVERNKEIDWEEYRRLPADYEEIGAFRSDLNHTDFEVIRVKRDKKWGFILWNKNDSSSPLPDSDLTIPLQYDVATDFFERSGKNGEKNLVARVFVKKYNLFFYINLKGEMLVRIRPENIID